MNSQIEKSWDIALQDECEKPYFAKLMTIVSKAYASNKVVYPPQEDIFSAFHYSHFNDVRVVILGQDPYHGEGQAHGLCFSVPNGVRVPPSLRNIYKELQSDLGIQTCTGSGNLSPWATQGVLLLNAILTVEAGKAGSHHGLGWEEFTDAVIRSISEKKEHVVFLLWGKFAHNKGAIIDTTKHLVLQSSHPSPLSARKGFFGCKHFSKTNDYLRLHHRGEINWCIPS